MLVGILICCVLTVLFTMAAVGHLSNIEKLLTSLTQAKLAELKMFNGK